MSNEALIEDQQLQHDLDAAESIYDIDVALTTWLQRVALRQEREKETTPWKSQPQSPTATPVTPETS